MEDLAIILDARHLQRYGLAHAQMYGGTELLALRLASGLAARGHEVHVIAPDLAHAEHRGPLEWWWPPTGHPDVADVVVGVHGLLTMGDLDAPMRVLLANAIDPPGADVAVDASERRQLSIP